MQKLEKGTKAVYQKENAFAELNFDILQKWQNLFCEASKVYACCLDGSGRAVTAFSGKKDEVAQIRENITDNRIQAIFERVVESSLEDQAVEETAIPNLKLAAVAVRRGTNFVFVWIICAVLEDADLQDNMYHFPPIDQVRYSIKEDTFYHVLDLMRESMGVLFDVLVSRDAAMEQSENSKQLELQMSNQFRRAAVMTEIVSQLDSDDTIEKIMETVLRQIGEYLHISHGFLCKVHREDDLMDIAAQWNAKGTVASFDSIRNLERFWFLHSDKTLMLSSDTLISAGKREQLDILGIKAIASFPIKVNDEISFYGCFAEKREDRTWNLDEVKFMSDAVRILQSIITKRIQKNSLASSFASLEAILDNVGSAIYVRDIKTNCMLFANRSLRSHFSKELREGTLEELFEENVPARSHSGNYEIYHEERGRWYDLYYTHIAWVDGRQVSLCAIYDSTEKKLYQKKIEQQAYTDFLTGLYNRMCCERDLARYIDEAQQTGQKGAVFYLDLDDFKHINDGLGHQYGDLLLKTISRSLQSISGIHNTCYRMGGDEFVIIIPAESFSLVEDIIKKIQDIFSRSWYLKDADYYCTMSMGTVEFPTEGSNVAELIKKADIAMYEAKKSGKNRIARYSDNIDSTSSRRLDMEKNMRDAMVKNYEEFEIYYQAIVDNQTQGTPCVGAEALVRWNSKMGFISPGEFIPLAEYLGLINPIGNHVLEEACKACRVWNISGHPEYRINVNLSVVQLLQPDIIDIIQNAIDFSQIDPQNLVLEITESLAINDLDRTKSILMKIKRLGVRVALDDFGTGYSSLNNIRALPFDIIKVDQNFVKDLAEDNYSQSFIRMIAELGEAIGADICVEGIETKGQYQALENMKVHYIQGYYFDRPITREEFEGKYVTGKESGTAKRKRMARSMDI